MYPGRGGVTAPANQGSPRNEGSPNTVVNATKCEFVVVEYFDGDGRRCLDAMAKVGDEYYTPDNSRAWAMSLKRVNDWLKNGIRQKLPIESGVRITDAVDILGGGQKP